jgi:hypothetical protein
MQQLIVAQNEHVLIKLKSKLFLIIIERTEYWSQLWNESTNYIKT